MIRRALLLAVLVPLLAVAAGLGLLATGTTGPLPALALIALGVGAGWALGRSGRGLVGGAVDRREARLRSLAETGRLLLATVDTARIVEIVSAQCRQGLDVDDAAIYLVDEERGQLRLLTVPPVTAERHYVAVLEAGEGVVGRAIAEQAPVWTSDALADPRVRYRPEARAHVVSRGWRALMAVPFARERTVGALLVARPPGATFAPDEVEFASILTSQVAVALENARLFALERRRRDQIEALAAVQRDLAAELNVDRLLDLIIERACGLLESWGVVHLIEEGDVLVPSAWYGWGPWVRDARMPVGEGLAGTCARERRGMIVNDYQASPIAWPAAARRGVRRSMAQPLLARDRLLGVISVSRAEGGAPYGEADLALFETFANQAAIALENAGLYRAAQRQARHLEALDTVNRQVASSLDQDEVVQNIAAAAARFFDAPGVVVWVADPVARRLTRAAVVADVELAAWLPESVPFGRGGSGRVAETRQPILWIDASTDRRVLARRLGESRGLRYFAALPLEVGGRLVGVISMRRAEPPPATAESRSLITSFTAHAAAALDHARLHAETAGRLEEARSLLEVTRILNSTLDARRLLREVARTIARVCGVDRCSIGVWRDGITVPLESQFADGRREPQMWERFVTLRVLERAAAPGIVEAVATRAPVVIENAASSMRIPREWAEVFGVQSCMLVPLVRPDDVMGIMVLDYCRRAGRFSSPQVHLAMAIGTQLAFALDNTRLYAEVRERLAETSALLAVGQALSQPGPVEEVLRRLAREVAHAFGADTVGTCMIDAPDGRLIPVAGYHVPAHLREVIARPLELDRFPAFREAARTGRAIWSPDPARDPRFEPDWYGCVDPHSVLLVPTRARGETIGGLVLIWWHTGREFTDAEIRLAEGIASQVGLAMENVELNRRTREKLRETEALLAVSRSLTSTLDLPALLRQFLRHVQQVLGSDSAGVWLRESDSPWILPAFGYRIPPERLGGLRCLRISIEDHPFYAEGFRTRRPQTSSEVAEDPRFGPAILAAAIRHRSQIFVPIVAKDVVIGGVSAVWWNDRREFSDSELVLMETVASQAGVAIENARLFQDNQRRLEELSLLYELSQAVTGQLDRQTLVETIYRQLSRVLDGPTGGIASYDETKREFEILWAVKDGTVTRREIGRRYPFGVGLMSCAVERRQTIRADDYVEACRREGVTPLDESLPHPYWLGAPMVAGDAVVGVIAVRSGTRPFSDEDARLLTNIAGLAGLAFRSARLYEERARAYSELVAAQDHLLRADKLRALGEMASGVAHDFNNLLTSIVGRAQMLLRRIEEPRYREWLEVIERAALDGAQTVRRLQEFTRIRRDQAVSPVDLNRVVTEALEVTQFRRDEAASRGVDVQVRTSFAGLAFVLGDPVELREALTNLILNALDAMPSGGVLTLATGVDPEHVALTVQDTGVGMTDEARRRLFEPFFTTKGARGTGLGLSMVFGIVSRHGGRVEVQSAPGRGARFELRFPLAAGTDAPPPPPGPTPGRAEPVRCLVVDDEPAVRELLGDVLATAGHTIALAAGGREAIERVQREPFDIVLTDLGMPEVSGWQVARACKAARPDAPVLLVTGWGVELSRDELAAHGVDAVLPKPLKVDQVLEAVAAWSARRRPASA